MMKFNTNEFTNEPRTSADDDFKGPYPCTFLRKYYFSDSRIENTNYFYSLDEAKKQAIRLGDRVSGITKEFYKGQIIYTLRVSKKLKINRDEHISEGILTYIKKDNYDSPPTFIGKRTKKECEYYFKYN